MKILSIEGNFGKIRNQKLEFNEGFTIIRLNNEGGKTTWSNFIRVMLYGLNKSRRDTKVYLSEKSKYYPHDGGSMYGRMRIMVNNRVIIISRTSGKAGPMQEFSAIYEDTGKVCTEFTGRDCGKLLTGLSEEAYTACGFIDGTEMGVDSKELEDSMLAMLQSGDSDGLYNRAKSVLNRMKLDIKTQNKNGEIFKVQAEIVEINDQKEQHEVIDAQISKYNDKMVEVDKALEKANNLFDTTRENYTENVIKAEISAKARLLEVQSRIKSYESRNIDEEFFKKAQDDLFAYDGALEIERESREKLPKINEWYKKELDNIYESSRIYEEKKERFEKLRIKWWALIMGALLFAGAGFNLSNPVEVGTFTPYMTYILLGFGAISVIIAFAGSIKKFKETPVDIDELKKELEISRKELEYDHDCAANITGEAYERLMKSAHALDADCTDIESTRSHIAEIKTHLKELATLRLEETKLQIKYNEIQQEIENKQHSRLALSKLEGEIAKLNIYKQSLISEIGSLSGRKSALMQISKVETRLAELLKNESRLKNKYTALELAEKTLDKAESGISAKLSPEINRLCAYYFSHLTSGKYDKVYVGRGFDLLVGKQNSPVRELEPLRLSTGTRDQLYLALRLAVCKVLAGKIGDIPLVLDDPFMSFDNEREENAVELFKKLAIDRQIIMFTARRVGGYDHG